MSRELSTVSNWAVSRAEPFLAGRAETQLRGQDDAGADGAFAVFGDAVADAARWSTDQIRQDIGVEQIGRLGHGWERLEFDGFG